MTSALLEELNTVAIKIKRSQIKDTEGNSWGAMAVVEDPQGRGIEALLVDAGAERGGGEGGG